MHSRRIWENFKDKVNFNLDFERQLKVEVNMLGDGTDLRTSRYSKHKERMVCSKTFQ